MSLHSRWSTELWQLSLMRNWAFWELTYKPERTLLAFAVIQPVLALMLFLQPVIFHYEPTDLL